MKRIWIPLLLITHIGVGAAGFALGIYALPILIAPDAPSEQALTEASEQAEFKAEFVRDLPGSDGLHWGEGLVSVSQSSVSFQGDMSPGPDYKLYLSPEFVDDEASFEAIKPNMTRIGDVKSFDGFMVAVPEGVSIRNYNTVVVWCETFGEFISAAQYR